ncbi:unnamed protein product [Arabis nemorensis]|uniref:Uncharacterized protein n=1 Tax=Arabis nemorensis TaxID=586526 RepID=A0A565ATZ6_9BRAS|nr:unnamed protein product [Arabis nemorensis]
MHLTTIPIPSALLLEDCVSWHVDGVDCKGYPTSKTWEVMRPRQDFQAWIDMVWYKVCIPYVGDESRSATYQTTASFLGRDQ